MDYIIVGGIVVLFLAQGTLFNQLIEIKLRLKRIIQKENQVTVALDGVRTEIANLKAAEQAQTDAITALAARLDNNPTAEEIAAVAADLRDVATAESAKTDAINALDPDVPTGPIVDDGAPV